MANPKKSYVWLIAIMTLLVLLPLLVQPIVNLPKEMSYLQTDDSGIVLDADKLAAFNVYSTNGTLPMISGNSATFYGSDRTNVYSDAVSCNGLKAQENLLLQASVSVSIKNLSSTGNDQFAIFAADNIISYKGDEFGFVLPETGDTWYAYIQSPQIPGFFVWQPVLKLAPTDTAMHNLVAVYSNIDSLSYVDFYLNGKLAWSTLYPNVSNQSFHLVVCSHKVSDEAVDTSQNVMQVEDAYLTGNASITASFPYDSLL